MAEGELDLSTGEAQPSERSERRRRRRESSSSSGKSSTASEARQDSEVASRLDRVFDRLAKWRDTVEDEELAEVIREDGEQMAQGIVSLTSSFKPLRMPIIMFLNLLEPVLAFGRVIRILWGRLIMRRQRVAEERERAMAEAMTPEEYAATVAANGG